MEPKESGYPEDIQALLEKYWGGETTLAEEEQLREYISNRPDAEFNPHEAYFRVLVEESKRNEYSEKSEDEAFEEHIAESPTSRQTQGRQITIKKEVEFGGLNMKWWSGIAAGIAIAIVVGWQLMSSGSNLSQDVVQGQEIAITEGDSFTDPKQAYEETMKALMLVSRQLNQGREQASKISILNQAQKTVQDSLMN